MVLKYRMGS